MIIDSHCHLDFDNLYNDLDNVIKWADINEVKYLLTISTNLKRFEKIKIIVEKYKNVYGTFGIHPHETKDFKNIEDMKDLEINPNDTSIGFRKRTFVYDFVTTLIQKINL